MEYSEVIDLEKPLKPITMEHEGYKFVLGDTNEYMTCIDTGKHIRYLKGETPNECMRRYIRLIEGGNEHLVQLPPDMPAAEKASDSPAYDRYISWILKHINQMNCNEITITLKPKIACMEYMYIRSFIKQVFRACFGNTPKDSKVIILYEISNSGMFHYHGIITNASVNALNNIRKNLNMYVGRTEIKHIRNMTAYINYMLKRYTTERDNYETIEEKYDLLMMKKTIKL